MHLTRSPPLLSSPPPTRRQCHCGLECTHRPDIGRRETLPAGRPAIGPPKRTGSAIFVPPSPALTISPSRGAFMRARLAPARSMTMPSELLLSVKIYSRPCLKMDLAMLKKDMFCFHRSTYWRLEFGNKCTSRKV